MPGLMCALGKPRIVVKTFSFVVFCLCVLALANTGMLAELTSQ